MVLRRKRLLYKKEKQMPLLLYLAVKMRFGVIVSKAPLHYKVKNLRQLPDIPVFLLYELFFGGIFTKFLADIL